MPGWSPPQHPAECRLRSLPLPRAGGGFWGVWQGPGCWKGPEQAAANAETHPGVTLDPSTGRGERQQQQWEVGRSGRGAHIRDRGCRTNTAPESAALPSPSLPWTLGVSCHRQVEVRAKKQQEAAAAAPREPSYCTAEQGTAPSSGQRGRDASTCPRAQPDPGAQGRGDRAQGAGGSPTMSPPAAGARAGLGPGQPRLGG